MVLPGVTLGEGCAIGAMSLVMKDVEPWSIYAGIPAKKIKERKNNLLKLEKQFREELLTSDYVQSF
jgi:acetyltransferase-like isoleucine patch superfamily enzyme